MAAPHPSFFLGSGLIDVLNAAIPLQDKVDEQLGVELSRSVAEDSRWPVGACTVGWLRSRRLILATPL